MKDQIESMITGSLEAIREKEDFGDFPIQVSIDVPKRKEFGDFSTNAALALSGEVGMNPRKLAELIISNIPEDGREIFNRVEVAGAGFINFFVREDALISKILEIEESGEEFGNSDVGGGEKVLVEFVSANPTGYLHMGHARGAAVGDAISNILDACGFEVTREFYINDAGRQIELLGLSVYERYRELFGLEGEIPEDGYRGEYIGKIASEIMYEKGSQLLEIPESEAVEFCREYARVKLLEEIKDDLTAVGVEFDSWYSEKERLHNSSHDSEDKAKLTRIKQKLREKGALQEKEGALWFEASRFGDSQDWVLVKSDGSPTYFFSDIAYHYDKVLRGYRRLVNVWGADHHGHVSRLQIALNALGFDESLLRVVLIQFVRLMSGGEEISMSKRSGSYVTMREVVEEVGRDATRFFLLMRSSDSHLDFDLDLAKETSSENPVYYIQYAHARIGSVLEKAEETGFSPSGNHLDLLGLPEELEIVKKLLIFPEVVRDSGTSLSPHKLAFYLQDLASDFHVYYNKHRILGDVPELSYARLYFVGCIKTVIRNGLRLLGVSAPERM